MLELKDLTKKYGQHVASDQVNLVIGKGEFFCLLGPSGCGKTTVLRLIAGFEKVTSGSILLDGTDITKLPPNQRDVNTVFQNYALFPNFNVFNNIAYGLSLKKTPQEEIAARVEKMVQLAGLSGFEYRMPGQLSGGQQQRVALARALINEPRILLLDEPLSALDKKIAEQTRIELAELQRKVGITFVFVTHNQTEALALADRIAVMNNGVIEQCDSPREIYEHPRSHFVADFIGNMNVLNGKTIASEDESTLVALEDTGRIRLNNSQKFETGKTIIFCIRPERMRISLLEPNNFENSVRATIRTKVYIGDVTHYHLELSTGKMVKVIEQNYLLQLTNDFYDIGEEVSIHWSQTSGEIIYA
ncbi:MAG: ABC transporter ATP-binding protein [Bacteroidota bacterium]